MTSRDSLLLALVVGLVGAGAGFFFASMLQDKGAVEASGPHANQRADDSAPVAGASMQSPAATLEEPTRAPAAAAAARPSPRVPEAKLERALAAVPEPEVAPALGTGTILGEVRDVAGAPLEGVVVVARRSNGNTPSDPSKVGAGAPTDQELEDWLRESAQSWAEARAGRQRAVSTADGGFELTGLVPGADYRLEAYLEGHVLRTEGSAWSFRPGDEVSFRAEAVHVIPVQLVHADGSVPAEGIVTVERGDDTTSYAWSARAPHLRLTAGRVGVRGFVGVSGAGMYNRGVDSTHASQELSIDVVDQAGLAVELVLEPRSGIRGRVTDRFGASEGARLVRLLPVPSGGEVDDEALANSDRHVWLAGTRFHFLDLEPGTYALGLSNWNGALFAQTAASVDQGVVEVELVVPEPDPTAHLILRAYGPSGNPLGDLDFRWTARSGTGSSSGGLAARRAPDGAYWLRPKAAYFEAWGEEDSFTLTVQHSELGDKQVSLVEGQREVDVTYEEPVAIVVVVAGYAGSEYVGRLKLALTPLDGEDERASRRIGQMLSSGNGEQQISPEGVARFEGLAPGRWKVELQVGTDRWRGRTVETVEVQAGFGEQAVAMSVPVLYDVVVISSRLEAGTQLRLGVPKKVGNGLSFSNSAVASFDADGRAVFEDLSPGEYVLFGSGIGSNVEITVPSADVYLDEELPDCFRVAIGDTQGALYAAGLRAGDLIVAVNGADFGTVSKAHSFFRGDGEVPVTVLRDGERLEFSVAQVPEGGEWLETLGGMLTPASRP